MTVQQNNALPTNSVEWVRIFSSLTMILTIVVLCGWSIGVDEFNSIWSGLLRMKANTAVGLLMSGSVLFLQTFPAAPSAVLWVRRLTIALVLSIGLLTLSEYFFNWDAGIDQLLFPAPKSEILTPFPGRMSVLTAGCLALLGGAFLFIELNRCWHIVQGFAFAACIVALLPIAGYLYDDFAFPWNGASLRMSVPTALGILLLSMGILVITSLVGFCVRLQKMLPALSIGGALALLALSGYAVLHGLEKNKIAKNWVEHTYEVSLHVETAVANLHEFRVNTGAFLFTLEDRRLVEADRARERLLSELDTVKRLTIDNLNQQQRLDELRPVLQQRFAVADELIKIRRDLGPDAVLTSAAINQADRLAVEIIERFEKIREAEFFLLRERQQAAMTRNSTFTSSLGVTILFSMVLLFGTLRALRQEIKQHIRSENLLRKSESRSRALFNTSAIGIVVIDELGCIEEFNPASEAIFAYSQEEVVGQNVNMLMPEPFHGEHDGYLKNYLSGKQAKIIGTGREVIGKRKDNTTFPMELNVGEAKFDSGRAFVGFIQDISKRKQIESASRQFEAIVQSSDDAIMSKTLKGIVTSWNASAEHMFGYTAEEMIGSPMRKLFPVDRVDEEKSILAQIAQGQRVSHFETIRIRKDGSPINVSVSLSPIFDEHGNVIGTSKIARDITQSKRIEQELYEAKQVAEAASRSKSEFLANMSHEIRTPMNAIIGLTRLASETELTPKQQDYLQKIQVSSQALLGILNDILDLSKIESGRMEIEHIEFDPTKMLQSVSDLFIAKAEERGLEIFLDIAPEIPLTVVGDPLRIQQILTNLVSNAIKFTPKGEIHIRMELKEKCEDDIFLCLSVRDTGIGISEAVIERLFQPFSQADASTTRKFGGTGLGLVISKQLAELMGGSIMVSSQLGQGSTFSFTVHCDKGQTYNWNQDSHHLKDTRVLVIDDQETSCVILRNILESWKFQVTTVLSAEEALHHIHEAEQAGTPFDLLLVDWQMEGMNGLELAKELEQKESQGKLKHSPTIIMVTAYNKEQLLKEASDKSARLDAILTKPVVPSNLLNTILHVYHYKGNDYRISQAHTDPYEAARPLRNARLLLVEDNELNQQVASEFLQKAGLRISIANHGGEAVQWVQKENFDAVLMDLQMPEMDGYEATRHIRKLPGGGNIPIIAMTAAAMQHDRKACLDAGMNDHVAKPINPRELIDTLLRWVKPSNYLPVSSLSATPSREPWSDLADKLPGFELRDIMVMLSNNEEQLLRMLSAFREQFINEVSIITSEISDGDLDDVKKRLHTLNGSAGNLGAKDLHQAGIALHAQLVNGRYDAATLNHWVKTFGKTMDTLAAIPVQSPSVASSSDDMLKLQQVISELDALLAQDSFVSDDLLTRFKTMLPDNKQPEYDTLIRHILDTDYPKARSVLSSLAGLSDESN